MEDTKSFMAEKIRREFGEAFKYISNPNVTDVLLNSDNTVWVYEAGKDKISVKGLFTSASALRLLGSVAAYANTVLTADNPLLQAALPWGQRFQGIIPPVVASPVFAVRNHSTKTFKLDDYVASGRMPDEIANFLRESLVKKRNIIVSGGTGSGKTTLTIALMEELSKLCPNDRLCVMEDTRELQSFNADNVFEQSNEKTSMTQLLAVNLRMRPDRIILGEIRGAEALDLLKSWNTGHPGGISTVHANSASAALIRFEELILEAQDLNMSYMRALISEALNVVVHIERRPKIGPKVVQVMLVNGLTNEKDYRKTMLYDIMGE